MRTVANPTQSLDQWQSQLLGEDLQLRRQAAIASLSLDPSLQRELMPVMIDRLLREKDGQVRLAILATVTEMGPAASEAVEALAESMRTDHGGRENEETHQDYRAALALAAIGPPAVAALRGLLDAEATNDRAEAAMALGRIGPAAAGAAGDLVRRLEDDQARVRQEASQALGRIGEAALDELLQASDHSNPAVRAAVIDALGEIPIADVRRFKAIETAMSDNRPEVRAAAIRAVDSLELTSQVWQSIMLENLRHDDDDVRLAVINAVLRHRDRLNSMEAELSELLHDESDGVADHAAFLLHRLGPESIATLLAAVDRETGRVESIGRAISLMGPPAVAPLMAAIRSEKPRVRQVAALALGKIRPVSPDTVAALGQGLDDPDPETQEAFLESIGSLATAGRAATTSVRTKLNDSSPSVRAKAVAVLFQVASRDQELVGQLSAMIDDADPVVQRQAIDTLRAVGPLGRQALPAVIAQLANESMEVRLSAAEFIGSHGSAAGDAVDAFVAMLHDENRVWRLTVIATLGQLGSASRPAFTELSALMDDPDQDIRSASVDAVGNLGLESESLLPYLARVLHDQDQEVRSGALRIIRRLGDDAIILVPDIIPLAANEEERRSIQRALERLERLETDPTSVVPLRELLDHEDTEVRRLAIRFLGLAGASAAEVVPRLKVLLQDTDEAIRKEAESAPEKLEPSAK